MDGAESASSSSARRTCALWASQRAWASVYWFSQASRWASKPSILSWVSGSKPSGYL